MPLGGAKERKIAVLRHENSRSRDGFAPDRAVGRVRHPEFGDVTRIVPGLTHGFRECRWKLSIDQVKQAIWLL
jgi:hypothetical protein